MLGSSLGVAFCVEGSVAIRPITYETNGQLSGGQWVLICQLTGTMNRCQSQQITEITD